MFGNIFISSGTVLFEPTYNDYNQYATLPAATPTYDANGNLTYDGFHHYQWDADGNLASLDNGLVVSTYDALGRRVEQVPSSGASTQVVWDPVGWRRAAMNGQTLSRGLIQLPGQSEASYASSGFLAIRHADWQGSTRLATTPSGTYLGSVAVSPYGYIYASGGSPEMNFTDQRITLASDLWDLPARELHPTQGRWISPDKAGLAAVDITDPQTWNRYAYVRDTPTSLVDPSGLMSPGCPYGTDAAGNCLPKPCPYGTDAAGNCLPPPYSQLNPGSALDLCIYWSIFCQWGGGSSGGATGGASKQINKTWSKTFPCNKSAQRAMSAVQNDMGRFADNRGTLFSAIFPSQNQPITMGGEYVIQPGFNNYVGGQFPTANLVVSVTSQSANGWTFTTDPSQHFFNGTVSFSSTDAGNGNITFSVSVNADWVSPFTDYTIGPVILAEKTPPGTTC